MTLGSRKPERLLYFTKESFLRVWTRTTEIPGDVAVLCQGGIPTQPYCEVLRRYARWVGQPLLFVGDLDPLDLTIFAVLGSARYLGIDDRWLGLCRSYLRPTIKGLDAITIKMGETEREHLEVVKRLLPRLEQIIGPECFAVLESGRKLELEGAAHLGLYRKGFGPALSELLLRDPGPGRSRGYREVPSSSKGQASTRGQLPGGRLGTRRRGCAACP